MSEDLEHALAGGAPQRVGWFRFHFADQRWEWSPQVQQMHGYQPGTVVPTTELVLSHKHPDDYGPVAATLAEIRRTSGAFSTRHRIVDTRGEVHSVVVIGDQLCDDSGAVIGDRVTVQNNVSVYTGVTVGDDVFVGPSAVFTNDLVPRAFAEDWVVTPTIVGHGASIGANATIVCGNDIGEFAMVGAGSVVTRSVRPHQLVVGNPARHAGWVDRRGHVVSRDDEPPPAELLGR